MNYGCEACPGMKFASLEHMLIHGHEAHGYPDPIDKMREKDKRIKDLELQIEEARKILSGGYHQGDNGLVISRSQVEKWLGKPRCSHPTSRPWGTSSQSVCSSCGESIEKRVDEMLECNRCHQKKPDVCERPDGYANDVGNDPEATHIACDECDHENNMDI